VLSKKTANNMVTATINLRFGDETTLANQITAARFAANLLMQGTKTHTRQQLQEEFRKLNAQVNVGIAAPAVGQRGAITAAQTPPLNNVTASITAPAQNFTAAVRLAVEILKEPAYPQDEFDRLKTQRLTALAVTPTEPNQLAGERLDRYLSPFAKGDAQYTPTREELLSEVQNRRLDDVRKFHQEFYGANYGVFAVVGPISLEDVQRTAAELLGSWNTSKAYKPLITPFKKMAPINEKIETPDKANALFLAGQRFQMSQNDPDYPAMVLAGYMWGGPITSRVSDRIRNREGLSYGANSGFNVPTEGDSALLQGQVTLNPAAGPRVEFSFLDELRRVHRDGFTESELAEAKKAFLDSRVVGRSNDAALLNLILLHEQLDRPFTWDENFEAAIRRLTLDEVNAAFRKHIDPNGVSIVKAGDFKAAGVFQ
jgi:zinc protease